ncbi:MAG: type II toxin-antitoxin system RelE/ParE family toxin [Gammaproteobacteria bacterium]|nr:type II toxin-antitoxin system RelE/ParE family toxin [Gammaproteobacteria bacterium]
MAYQIIFPKEAKLDLKELKNYIVTNFSIEIWRRTYSKVKNAVNNLMTNPEAGGTLSELNVISSSQYRQIISGMNRIIYDIRKNIIYIHIVADSRRDMTSLVTKRLLRS